jgi:hypothetical protein
MKKKQIVFIEPFPIAMIYKIAREFKKKGYETVLIRIIEANSENYNFYKNAYDRIIDIDMPYTKVSKKNFLKIGSLFLRRIVSISSAFIEILKLKPYVIFGRAPLSTPIAFFRILFRNYPFVYFPYDIRRQGFDTYEESKKHISFIEMRADTFCFEKSDGILHKGAVDELDYLVGEEGKKIKLPKYEVNIQPYCSKEFMVPINKNKLSKKDGEIHMVYIGGTGKKDENFYFEQFKSAKEIIDEGIHAHFYFGSEISNPEELKKEELIKKSFFEKYKHLKGIKYFHLEKSFNAKEIAKEISKYDFGFWPRCDFNVELANGNKFSTFIEAGIPFFYFKKHKTTDKVAKKYGLHVLRVEGIKSFKKIIDELDYGELLKGVEMARKDYLMENNFERLEKFVEDVVAGRS